MKKLYNLNSSKIDRILNRKKGAGTLVWLTMCFMFLFGQIINAQPTIQIGSGSGSSSAGSLTIPVTNYNYSYTQQIITAEQFAAGGGIAGNITKVRFKPTSIGTLTVWNNWTVYIGNTTKETFTGTTVSDWVPTSEMLQVFSGIISPSPTSGNWFEITFSTPFNYTGGNIVLAIDENTPGWTSAPAFSSYTAGTNRGIVYRDDGINLDPTAPVAATGRTATLPQLQFVGAQESCTGVPTAGTSALSKIIGNAGSTFVASTSGTTGAAGITYQWQKFIDGAWLDILGATTTSTTIVAETGAVGVQTNYRLKVTCANSGEISYSTEVTFTIEKVYCTSVPTSKDNSGITNVVIGTTSFPVASTTFYEYPTTIELNSGLLNPASVTFATGYSYHTNIWIDFNNNGTFESTEIVFQGESVNANPTVLNTSFFISDVAPIGTFKMRIGTADSGQSVPNPCYSGGFGVTIDAMANINPPPTCFKPSGLISSNIESKKVTLTWTASSSTPTNGYDIYYSTSDTAPLSATVPTINDQSGLTVNITGLTPLTNYFWWVRSDCDATDKSLWTASSSFTTLSDTCLGTPAPGNTIASTNSICLGANVSLSLENETEGLGVTYQWKSSTDGVTYTNIVDATNASLTVTPLVATYYLAEVTCSAGPATGTSTAVYVTFGNSIATTTPGARCGVGTVSLAATASDGATISWYANATGGVALANGVTFETPSIDATTTFYAAAVTSSPANVAIGNGTALTSTTSQNSIFCNYWASGWRQIIYSAAELNAAGLTAGNINSVAFTINSLPIANTVNNFTVRIGASASATTTSTFATTGLNVVFGPVNYTPVIGVNTLTLSAPYNWDGVSNILVDIREDGQYDTANSATYATTTSTNTVVHGFASGSAPSAAYYTSNPTGSTSTLRPNIIFGGQAACTSGRVAVLATVNTPPALTLSATTLSICNSSSSSAITLTSSAADYDTYIWSPAEGVSGNATAGWVFNPTVTTTYTLTASQSAGDLCATTISLVVNINPIPAAIVFDSATEACLNAPTAISFSGGTLGVSGKIGSGTAANTTTTPFRGFYGGIKTQSIYTAAELSALGMTAGQQISTIGFVALSGTPNVLNDFSVKAGFTSASTLGASFSNDATNVIVASGPYTASTGNGNIDYTLTTPLLWDGVSNLLVETCFNNNNGGGGSANSISVQSSTVASGMNLYFSADNNATVCSSGTPVSSTNRPNLRITASESTDIVWSPITNLFSDQAATVPYVNGDSASTVYFKSNTAGDVTYTVTATTGDSCSITASTTISIIDCSISYANLQFPGTATVGTCTSPTFYAQVYKEGVTEAPGQGAGITAWIGKNDANTDPSTWAESSWELATFNVQAGNNDEYQVTFAPSTDGVYYVASRFVFEPGQYVYGGFTSTGGGIWDGTTNVSGVLTVETTIAPTASAQSFCNEGTVAGLMAMGTDLQWYDVATGGAALTATTALASGNYYVSQTLNSCESARTMVAVTLNVTAEPTADAQSFCNTATVAGLMAMGTDLQWYDVATGGTALTATTALASGNYYVSQTLNACESERTMVAVTVNVTAAPTASAQSFCNEGTVAGLMATGTDLQWYDVATGGTALAATTTLASGNYYVSQTLNACESVRTMVVVTVGPTAAPTGTALQDFTAGQTLANFTVVGANIIWYSDATGSSVLPSTTVIVSGVTYYASQTINGCESISRLAITAGEDLKTPSFELSNLRYYPNPVQSVLTVEYSETIEGVQLYNMLGQMVYNRNTNSSKVTIEMTSMAAGNYIMQVTVKGITKNVKVIKK